MEKPRDSSPGAEELAFISWMLNEMMYVGLSPTCCYPSIFKTMIWEIMTEPNDVLLNL